MKKKKVFVNKINNQIDNNQKFCKVNEEELVNNNISVEDKINKILNTNGYIFNLKVKIITANKTYDTKIATIVGNNIITLDNEIINIKDVKDIVY